LPGRVHRWHGAWRDSWILRGSSGLRIHAAARVTERNLFHQRGGLGFNTYRHIRVERRGGNGHDERVRRAVLERFRIGCLPLHRVEWVVGPHLVGVSEQRIRVVDVCHESGAQPSGELHSIVTQRTVTVHLNRE